MIERGMIAPNFHLRLSLTIVYFLGTWPPVTGKFRLPYLLYTICSFIFILGILLSAEIANVLTNWGDMSKLTAVVTLLMTNCTHASKVTAIILKLSRIRPKFQFRFRFRSISVKKSGFQFDFDFGRIKIKMSVGKPKLYKLQRPAERSKNNFSILIINSLIKLKTI